MERKSVRRQVDASRSKTRAGSPQKRGLPVPNWFDMPLLLPDQGDVALAKLQRTYLEQANEESAQAGERETRVFHVPKVSHLSPQKERERAKQAAMQRYMAHRRQNQSPVASMLKPRARSHRTVVLDRLPHQRSRLRDKIWSDLQRFGLWHIGGSGDVAQEGEEDTEGMNATVDSTVDAIMTQWGVKDSTEAARRVETRGNNVGPVEEATESVSSVFLTAVPATWRDHRASVGSTLMLDGEDGGQELLDDEDDGEEEEEDDAPSTVQGQRRKPITAPGLKRRQRLKDLHQFVEKQLQKRLFRSWETIEIALSGSGDLSVHQIVKFLQNSDVKLSATDAAKVQSILDAHVNAQNQLAMEEAQRAAEAVASAVAAPEEEEDEDKTFTVEPAISHTAKRKNARLLSYETFRKVFHPRDTQDMARWRREFDREKVRQRQEKEIYERELAALEEKVKKRLAESAKHLVELLDQFHCDPLAIPWENEEQRLEMRAQFLEVIFRKPARRRLSFIAASMGAVPPSDTSHPPPTVIPDKLAIPAIRSALLQKYSRNGHFESIEVPVAAYLFHDFAADAIKKSIKALWERRATDLWPERQLIFAFRLKKAVFYEWRRFTMHAELLRRYVMRKFVAWAYYTRKQYEYYAFYRTCFWPFYVWKRHLQQMIIARGKSVFLRNLVETYVQLRHFRAWQAHYQLKRWTRRQVARYRHKKTLWVLRRCWDAWFERLRLRLRVFRLWRSQGHSLQLLHKNYMVKVTFVLWRYYSILRYDLARRHFKCRPAMVQSHRSTHLHAASATGLPTYGRGAGKMPQAYSRGASWYPSTSQTATAQTHTRSTSLFASPSKHSINDEEDATIDAFVEEEGEEDDRQEANSELQPLSRIMETALAPKIKRKTRLYDLCLDLYLQCRERDRRIMTGNVIIFRRVGRKFLQALRKNVTHRKKQRFAVDLGSFRVLHQRFRWWLSISVYKNPLKLTSPQNSKRNLLEDQDESDEESLTPLELKVETVALDWRRDTEWRRLGLVHLPVEAVQLREDLLTIAAEDVARLERIQDMEHKLREKTRQEEIFLRKEVGATMKTRALQTQQAQQILRTRGARMHDVLDRAFDHLLVQQRRQRLRASFRGLRVIVMLKYTTTLCHRAQMRNWLRLCKKFSFWSENMPRFYEMKLKFHAFRTLLRHVVWKWKHETSGFSAKLAQRQQLIMKCETYLEKHGLLNGSAASARIALTKYSPTNSFHAVFLRWVQFTQVSRAYRQIIAVNKRKHELWSLHSVFQVLKTPLKAKYTFATRRQRVPFLYRQCVADLDALHCKILAFRKRLPTQTLRRQLALTQRHLQRSATGAPTLKQLFIAHEQEIRHRLFLENRLMFVAYNERRVHHYAERSSPLYGTPIGRAFAYEKAPPYASISELVVLCGKQVDGVSLVLKTNASATVEGQLHGNPFGTREVFTLSRGEKLVMIEGFASQTIYGLRFTTSASRVSKWFGHCEKGTKFELRSDWNGQREEIVGLHGYADATSVHALGCVYRYTTLKNIFEGLWLPNKLSSTSLDHHDSGTTDGTGSPKPTRNTMAHDDMALCDRQFAYFLQVRSCDVLTAMQRAHRLALRMHRMQHLPWLLTRPRVVLGLMRWYFNALTHGLVRSSDQEEEGKRMLQDGMNKRAMGEKMIEDGVQMLADVDSYRDEDKQLNVATLGSKKIKELKEMIEQANHKIVLGKRMLEEGQAEMLQGRAILPHIPMTKRMMNAIRRMYKVVQTKDYIDQMDPELRAILLDGESSAETATSIYDPV
ncbi:hypothetical protein Poli38472_000116 [Pythium oligandrum]|uniref:Jacalin-type lectin domain-containing protein n=1 Tax=Pythium oligandrum TaxID=41045 RepID=A0A8K1FGJ5_PYTOL|nr:hypothetical protein Poli38472_000116 [Pythium oligandrum]|eukprot:TMW60074.1 hypothetical protein Poli38472_000116 [Pythium oligandrum]